MFSSIFGRLAQLEEHPPYKRRVAGSSPASPTKKSLLRDSKMKFTIVELHFLLWVLFAALPQILSEHFSDLYFDHVLETIMQAVRLANKYIASSSSSICMDTNEQSSFTIGASQFLYGI